VEQAEGVVIVPVVHARHSPLVQLGGGGH
jgi:hypothetical protein